MPLVRIPDPFNDPDWIWELKLDGFRSLAKIDGHHCSLISRNGHRFRKWDMLAEELAQAEDRHELFEKRRKQEPRRGRWRRPELVLT